MKALPFSTLEKLKPHFKPNVHAWANLIGLLCYVLLTFFWFYVSGRGQQILNHYRHLEDFSSIWVIFSSHGLVAAHSCSGVPEGGSSAGDGVHGGLASLVHEGDPDSSSCQVAVGGCWNNLQDCLFLFSEKI